MRLICCVLVHGSVWGCVKCVALTVPGGSAHAWWTKGRWGAAMRDRVFLYVFVCVFPSSIFIGLTQARFVLSFKSLSYFLLIICVEAKVRVWLRATQTAGVCGCLPAGAHTNTSGPSPSSTPATVSKRRTDLVLRVRPWDRFLGRRWRRRRRGRGRSGGSEPWGKHDAVKVLGAGSNVLDPLRDGLLRQEVLVVVPQAVGKKICLYFSSLDSI